MENSNIKKQTKSDIFKELYPILKFYIQKGAKPSALKKYYKNGKRFNDILEDIKNKGINLVKDETEYHQLVKDILNEILDDFIAKEKDDKNKESKMKHIKEYNSFNLNESGVVIAFAIGFLLTQFVLSLIKKQKEYEIKFKISDFIKSLNDVDDLPVVEFSDRYYMHFLDIYGRTVDIRVFKDDKTMLIESDYDKSKFDLSDADYDNFLEIIGKNIR